MMTERNFIASRFLCGIVQGATAHSCAKTAGVALFSDIENNLGKLSALDDIFNINTAAKLLNLRIIAVLSAEARVNRYCNDIEFCGIKAAQFEKADKQGNGILTARNTDGNSVAVAYHIILLTCGAHITQKLLHKNFSEKSFYIDRLDAQRPAGFVVKFKNTAVHHTFALSWVKSCGHSRSEPFD